MSAFDQIENELAAGITAKVLAAVTASFPHLLKRSVKFCYSEKEAAAILDISVSTLRRHRQKGLIDFFYTIQPTKFKNDGTPENGKIAYMPNHIFDFMKRNEVRHGKQETTLADVLDFPLRIAA